MLSQILSPLKLFYFISAYFHLLYNFNLIPVFISTILVYITFQPNHYTFPNTCSSSMPSHQDQQICIKSLRSYHDGLKCSGKLFKNNVYQCHTTMYAYEMKFISESSCYSYLTLQIILIFVIENKIILFFSPNVTITWKASSLFVINPLSSPIF